MKIIAYGDPILRKQSGRIEEIDDEVRRLVDDMIETMKAAKGVGLAAPQVAVSRMLFVVDWSLLENEEIRDEGVVAYINPVILSASEDKVTEVEGCLSLPEVTAEVGRSNKIELSYQTFNGKEVRKELTGYPARVIQHEFDHLQGILFIDRLSGSKRAKIKGKLQDILAGRIKPFDGTQPNQKTFDNTEARNGIANL